MTTLKIGIISQARMTSSRLPGKVLLPIQDKTILEYHIERLQQSGIPVYIATTTNSSDDPIEDLCTQLGVTIYRGDENNVLQRYYECARENQLDLVIRVTSDCPLIDGKLIKESVDNYLTYNQKNIYLSNVLKRTYPRGFDFEVFSFKLLEEAFNQADRQLELEHVTPYINQNRSGNVEFKHITEAEDKSQYRLTLDTPEDLELIKILIEQHQAHTLGFSEIIKIMDENPGLSLINAHVEQKS